MKLLRVYIVAADTCGGLLDGLDLTLRGSSENRAQFDPLCLIGPNGAGKSQFLQVLAEMFQSAICEVVGDEERLEANPDLQFEIEYLITPEGKKNAQHVRISRRAVSRRKPTIIIQVEVSAHSPH